MKQFTKLLALLLVVSLAVGLMAGCNSNQETPSTTESNTTAATTDSTTAPVLEAETKVNAEIYPLDCDTTFEIVTAREDINEMELVALWEEVTGVDINWVTQQPDQVKLTLAGGDLPDAFFNLNASYIPKETIFEYGSAGKFINFMDYLEYMPNFAAAIADDPSILTSVQNADGTVYTLPRIGYTATSHRGVMYIRTDMTEAAGWSELPTTVEDFLQCMKDIQALYPDDPEFIAFAAYSKGIMEWTSGQVQWFFYPAFGELLETNLTLDSNGNVVLGAGTEQYKHYLEFMNEVYESGVFNTDVYTEDGTVTRARIVEDKVACSTHLFHLTPDNFESGTYEMAMLPPMTSQYYDERHWLASPSTAFAVNIITSDCEDIENLCRWFDSYYAPMDNPLNEEGTVWGISMSYGKLGEDFLIDTENKTYEVLPHDGYDTVAAWTGANSFGLSLGMYDFMYFDNSGNADTIRGKGTIEDCLPYAEDHFFLSNLPLTEDESMDYADYWTDINSYVAEMSARFITGDADIETGWDAYVSELENLGIQEVIDIYQGAYERFMSQQG